MYYLLNTTKFNLVLIYYFYINCCILNVNKCINLVNERLDPCQEYCDGSINSEIGGKRGISFRIHAPIHNYLCFVSRLAY